MSANRTDPVTAEPLTEWQREEGLFQVSLQGAPLLEYCAGHGSLMRDHPGVMFQHRCDQR